MGYDFPYIFDRSGKNLKVQRSVLKYAESSLFVQMKTVDQLPACIFIDAMYLLVSNYDCENKLLSHALDSLCNAYNLPTKK